MLFVTEFEVQKRLIPNHHALGTLSRNASLSGQKPQEACIFIKLAKSSRFGVSFDDLRHGKTRYSRL
jgi:hypothetical protein